MLMGEVCTRACRFCHVATGLGRPVDPDEPRQVAEAARELGLRRVVLTSVNRDDLPDQGYIAKVHPLDLWLLGYLLKNPGASLTEMVNASRFERQEVYSWLFKSRHQGARDSRIRTMVEIEAFLDIHQRWKRVGYPFDHLVPSLATAIGSSGDRPAGRIQVQTSRQGGRDAEGPRSGCPSHGR